MTEQSAVKKRRYPVAKGAAAGTVCFLFYWLNITLFDVLVGSSYPMIPVMAFVIVLPMAVFYAAESFFTKGEFRLRYNISFFSSAALLTLILTAVIGNTDLLNRFCDAFYPPEMFQGIQYLFYWLCWCGFVVVLLIERLIIYTVIRLKQQQ